MKYCCHPANNLETQYQLYESFDLKETRSAGDLKQYNEMLRFHNTILIMNNLQGIISGML